MAQPGPNIPPEPTPSPSYFGEALEDAERLLKYAAEIGIDVDPETRSAILHARAVYPGAWTEDIAAKLLAALTRLAARLRPVTAESLKAYRTDTRATVHTYLWIAIALACVIVPVSIASFVSSALSNAIAKDIAVANELAVKLRAQLGPPPPPGAPTPPLPPGVSEPEVIAELQEYASTIRVIYARARELHWFVIPNEKVPRMSRKISKRGERYSSSTLASQMSTKSATSELPCTRRYATLRRRCSTTSPYSTEPSRHASFRFSTRCWAPARTFCATSKTR